MKSERYKKFIDILKKAEEHNLSRKLKSIQYLSAKECIVNGKRCLNFSSNNYLALTEHPYIKEEMIKWTEKYGTGSGASRLVTGTLEAYPEVENKIAKWKKREAALIIGSGYLANTGIIPALADRHSIIFADRLNHASLNVGCLLSRAKIKRYKHNNMEHLQSLMENTKEKDKFIITDTVFSMDGDVLNPEIVSKYYDKALIYLDDAHATGILGKHGEGIGPDTKADIIMGTFSKAMGIYGAYVACSTEIKDFLINKCGSFIYSTALPPCIYGAINAAVDIIDTYEFRLLRKAIMKKADTLRKKLKNMNFDIGNSVTNIIPIILGDVHITMNLTNFLFENNILAVPIRPPTVPINTSRIRISVTAAHSDSNIEYLLSVLKKWRDKHHE